MAMRTYEITDDGDDFQLALYDGELQVGGAILPQFLGVDAAFEIAQELGEAFAQKANSGDR